jgi:hypothetical protein
MAYEPDTNDVRTATELLKTHAHEQVKQHIVLDAQGRVKYVFTAPISAKEDSPCMVDEYVYAGLTSTTIIARQERIYKWKASWDSGFVFDPTADYDPDGDGVL